MFERPDGCPPPYAGHTACTLSPLTAPSHCYWMLPVTSRRAVFSQTSGVPCVRCLCGVIIFHILVICSPFLSAGFLPLVAPGWSFTSLLSVTQHTWSLLEIARLPNLGNFNFTTQVPLPCPSTPRRSSGHHESCPGFSLEIISGWLKEFATLNNKGGHLTYGSAVGLAVSQSRLCRDLSYL